MSASSEMQAEVQSASGNRPSGLEWGLLVVGLIGVNHYAWLLDDAFIFFRYADNWVLQGNGLVYNRGEFVEGFTSPAWLLLLSAFRATGMDYWHIVRLVGGATFVLFWWTLVTLNRALSPLPSPGRPAVPTLNFPLAYMALTYGVLCYFTSGVETPLVQLTAVLFALYLVRPESWPASVAVGAATLIRPELALASALAIAYAGFTMRRIPWRATGVAAATIGSWIIFRVVYYAELLPNTFYLKDLADWDQGLTYAWETLTTYWVPLVVILFVPLTIALQRRRLPIELKPRLAMLGIAALIALYLVRVGGDPRHYRYLAFSFCLAAASLAGLAEYALRTWRVRPGGGRHDRALIASAGVLVALFMATRHPPQLGAHPIHGDVPHSMVDGINDAAYHRNHPRMRYPVWSWQPIQHKLPAPHGSDGYQAVSTASWCEWAWRTSNVRVIQNLGLTDPLLARVEMEPDRPAHKSGLQAMAEDIRAVHQRYTAAPGMYRLAVEQKVAADWIERNLETIELVERKIYNRHDPSENIGLAFTFTDRIQP